MKLICAFSGSWSDDQHGKHYFNVSHAGRDSNPTDYLLLPLQNTWKETEEEKLTINKLFITLTYTVRAISLTKSVYCCITLPNFLPQFNANFIPEF